VSKKTLGKDAVCRVFFFTLGKPVKIFFLGKKRRRKKMKKNFAECPDPGHSAKKENIFSGKEGEEKKTFAEYPDLGHSAK